MGRTLLGLSVLTAAVALGAAAIVGVRAPEASLHVEATDSPVDFALAIDGVCDTSGGAVECGILENTDFDVSVSLKDISGAGNGEYDALAVTIEYNGALSSNGVLSAGSWPDCYYEATESGTGFENVGCVRGAGEPSSTYTGVVVTGSFHCAQGAGVLGLLHGTEDTVLIDSKGASLVDSGIDSIVVNCQAPTPTPTETATPTATATPTKQAPPGDTDGDGCPDADENGPDERLGGRRDYLNPWDYFNPTNDGRNRVDDILAVVDHYFLREGEPGYDGGKYDRSLVGPDEWNLGPPDGQVLVDDILHAVYSYFHDCGEGIVKPTPTPTP